MKRVVKKKVAAVEPVEDLPAPTSPTREEKIADELAMQLPSPGKLVREGLTAQVKDARGMLQEAVRMLRAVEEKRTANALAAPVRCRKICYAAERKRRPLKPYTALGRLWEVKHALALDDVEHAQHQCLVHELRAEYRGAQIRLLQEKLRQIASRVPVRVQRKFGHCRKTVNPMARFKCSPSK
jgi:hypothetical protein